MPEQSHREAMNEAIRAQRERRNVPRSIAPDPVPAPEPKAPEPPPRRSLLDRLRNK